MARRADVTDMGPHFGRLTRLLAVIFVIAGVGAGFAGLNSGNQTTPGSGNNGPILIALGIAYFLIGAGLWVELVWAWWAGVALTSIVVVVDLVLGIHDGGLVIWTMCLALFAASAVQRWRPTVSFR